jgi:linoleoyl-CoA desaturase
MAGPLQVRYAERVGSSDFARTMTQRVDAYFAERQISRHADAEMVAKTVLGLVLWIATWAVLMADRLSPLGVVGWYVVHGFAQLYMAFNIAHDANHGAYSRRKSVNKLVAYVFDLVGVSSYMWRLFHNDSHHAFVNVQGVDTALSSDNLFRFCPQETRLRRHRWQHLYAPPLYCLSTLDWVLAKDFRWLLRGTFGNRRIAQHPRREIVLLFLFKAFYYTYVLVLPLLFLSVPWYAIVGGFVLMHAFLGFTIAAIFQPTHITEGTTYVEPDGDGRISNNYIRHVFDTTADFARTVPFANSLLGCLNLHVIHHMFPGICHVHYPALTEIVRATAAEFGLTYRENRTITGAFLAHLRWLRLLGRVDDPSLPAPAVRG